MKKTKALIPILLAFCILLSLIPTVLAANSAEVNNFENRSWDEIIEQFLKEHGQKDKDYPTVGLGYLNLVTGEEHYYNADEYMVAGSMYKIPINMLFTSRIARGEMDFDTKIAGQPYEKILNWTIVNSDNDWAKKLWDTYPSYHAYREAIAPLCGEDPETVDEMFYKNNYFTSRQIITCLKELYTNSASYPRLIDTLMIYAKNNMFTSSDPNIKIAQKYGYFTTDYHFYLTNCGIVYTDDPIALVIFTDNAEKPYTLIPDYCELMINYTQYSTAQRHEKAEAEAESSAIAALLAEAERLNVPVVTGSSDSSQTDDGAAEQLIVVASENESGSLGIGTIVLMLIIVLLGAAAIYLIFARKKKYKLNTAWAVAAVIISMLAMLICPFAASHGPVLVSVPDDTSPVDAVVGLFDSICDCRFEDVYSYLSNYSGLGLENPPSGIAGGNAYDALRRSYSYKLYGNCVIDGTHAYQQVLFRHLDLTLLRDALPFEARQTASQLAYSMPSDQVYDENGEYLSSFLDTVYTDSMNSLLVQADYYYTTTGLTIELEYTDGTWLVTGSTSLFNAICGGAAY